jgi:acyl-homoserine lactone acylase PvdQ
MFRYLVRIQLSFPNFGSPAPLPRSTFENFLIENRGLRGIVENRMPVFQQPPTPSRFHKKLWRRSGDYTETFDDRFAAEMPLLGSNNWAVNAAKSASGHAILANDPHLGHNLPNYWYEVDLHAPGIEVYGMTLPSSPDVIIGFNRDIAWGVTNCGWDVLDYYKINLDSTGQFAFIEGQKEPLQIAAEKIPLRMKRRKK